MPTCDDDRSLFGDANPTDCAKRIESYGVNEIVVKDEANPCLAFADGQYLEVTPKPVAGVIDTTGAVDSFNAGYIAARKNQKSPVEAAELAHLVAARVICGRSALIDMALLADLTSIH